MASKPRSVASRVRQKILARQIVHANQWFVRARGLAIAAQEVEPSVRRFWRRFNATKKPVMRLRLANGPSTHMAYFLLMGFAVENYLKGLLVQKNPTNVGQSAKKGNTYLARALGGHELVKIAKKAGFPFNAREEQLLFRLTANIVWAGRYPYALTGDQQAVNQRFPDGQKRDIRLLRGHIDPAKKLIQRLEKAAEATGWTARI